MKKKTLIVVFVLFAFTSIAAPGAKAQRPNLDGVWYDYTAWTNNAGLVCHIEQNGDNLIFINNSNGRSKGGFPDNSSVVAYEWEGGLKAKLENDGKRIVWSNGSVWERNLRGIKPNMAGVWYDYTEWTNNAGLVCHIEQNGDNLVFINNSNDRSKGNYLDNASVVAADWQGGLKAKLENNGQRIVWSNGSVWERNKR